MAKDKKSFVLYSDSQSLVNQLPDEVAGRLLKHIFAYVNDENPETDELLVNIAFEPIKNQLKRDLKKYERTIEIKSNGGKLGNLKRWNLDLYNKVVNKKLSIEELKNSQEWLEVVSSQLNSNPEIIKTKLDDFKTHLFTEDKIHQTKNEFLRHFKSWIPKNITAKKPFEFTHNR